MRSPPSKAGLRDPEAPRDSRYRLVALAGDSDHVTAELHRERLGHDVDTSSEERVLTGQESTEPWAVPGGAFVCGDLG
jgi:hypothetical protein